VLPSCSLRTDLVAARDPIRFCRRVEFVSKEVRLGPCEIRPTRRKAVLEEWSSVLVLDRVRTIRLLVCAVGDHCVCSLSSG